MKAAKKTRYQHLGDHLKTILNGITNDIDKYIQDEIKPKLPDLHSKDVGACKDFDTISSKDCNTRKECIVLHQSVCNCKKHRNRHLELWMSFIEYVVNNIIPANIERQINEVKSLNVRGTLYKQVLLDIFNDFSAVIKKAFVKLQNAEIQNHSIPLKNLDEFKSNLLKKRYIGNTENECIDILKQLDWPTLKHYANLLNIKLTNHNRSKTIILAGEICNQLLC